MRVDKSSTVGFAQFVILRQRHDPNFGEGSILSPMLPDGFILLVVWRVPLDESSRQDLRLGPEHGDLLAEWLTSPGSAALD